MADKKFTWADLKELISQMDEQQLNQIVPIFEGDAEEGTEVEYADVSQEDIYWLDGDCYGPIEIAKTSFTPEEWEEEIESNNFDITKKGTVTLHYLVV